MKCAVQLVAALNFAKAELEKAFAASVAHGQSAAAEKIRAAADKTREAIEFITEAEIGKIVREQPLDGKTL